MKIVHKQEKGFAMIMLILGLVVMVTLIAYYFTRGGPEVGGEKQSLPEVKQKAETDIGNINDQLSGQYPEDMLMGQ